MPPTPRSQDPYAITPPTPRPQPTEFGVHPGTPTSQSPTGRKPMDPYNQPRPGEHMGQPDQFRSPGNRPADPFAQNAGIGPESFSPMGPQPGMSPRPMLKGQNMWPGQEQDPYAHPPGTPHPHAPQLPHRMERQISAPAGVPASEATFPVPPTSDHTETTSAVDPFAQPPGNQKPQVQPPRPHLQRVPSMPSEGHVGSGGQFRPMFRPPHPAMMRPGMPGEPFPQQPGGPRPRGVDAPPHPGMRMSEASAVSDLFMFSGSRCFMLYICLCCGYFDINFFPGDCRSNFSML